MRYVFTKTVLTSDFVAGSDAAGKPILANRRFEAGSEIGRNDLASGCFESCLRNGTLIEAPPKPIEQEKPTEPEPEAPVEAPPDTEPEKEPEPEPPVEPALEEPTTEPEPEMSPEESPPEASGEEPKKKKKHR